MPKPDLHLKKTLASVWWSTAGVIHYEFLKPSEMIMAGKYCRQLDVFRQKLRQKQPALTDRKTLCLLHDNARPHTAKITTQKLHQLGYEIFPHPPYSPDLSPTDCFSSTWMTFCKRSVLLIKSAARDLSRICGCPRPSICQDIEKLVIRWQKCIEFDDSYFR